MIEQRQKDEITKPAFHSYEIANEFKRKQNKLWVDQGREFLS